MNSARTFMFRRLHRYAGLASAAILVMICATGVLLNHADALRLAQTPVATNWLLDWYGMPAPEPRRFGSKSRSALQIDKHIWIDGQTLPGNYDVLRGIVELADTTVVVTASELIVTLADNTLVEIIDTSLGLPANIERAGAADNLQLVIGNPQGIWAIDLNTLEWLPRAAVNIRWSQPINISAAELDDLRTIHRGSGLPLERIIMDLHSGRIFGTAGRWLADAAAILCILLAVTGIWMSIKRKPRNS